MAWSAKVPSLDEARRNPAQFVVPISELHRFFYEPLPFTLKGALEHLEIRTLLGLDNDGKLQIDQGLDANAWDANAWGDGRWLHDESASQSVSQSAGQPATESVGQPTARQVE